MKILLLRFEGPYAVCKKEDGSIMDIKRFNIPKEAKEGDTLDMGEWGITIENKMDE